MEQHEYRWLHDIGRAIAKSGHQLFIPNSKGAAQAVIAGYRKEGGTPTILDKGTKIDADETFVITDETMEEILDQKRPDWREQDWVHLATPTALESFWEWLHNQMDTVGKPL